MTFNILYCEVFGIWKFLFKFLNECWFVLGWFLGDIWSSLLLLTTSCRLTMKGWNGLWMTWSGWWWDSRLREFPFRLEMRGRLAWSFQNRVSLLVLTHWHLRLRSLVGYLGVSTKVLEHLLPLCTYWRLICWWVLVRLALEVILVSIMVWIRSSLPLVLNRSIHIVTLHHVLIGLELLHSSLDSKLHLIHVILLVQATWLGVLLGVVTHCVVRYLLVLPEFWLKRHVLLVKLLRIRKSLSWHLIRSLKCIFLLLSLRYYIIRIAFVLLSVL